MVFEKLRFLLDANNVSYKLMEHEAGYTSEQAAQVRGTRLQQGAKALVFEADKRPLLLVVAADRRIDSRAFKRVFGVKDLRLASAERMTELTGLTIGAVPPFGSLMGLPTYVDEPVLENEEIVFNAGSLTRCILMKAVDYLRLEQPIQGNFSSSTDSLP